MRRTYDGDDVRRARTGALLIVVIVLVALGIFFVDAILRATTEGPMITITAESAPGVETGTAVWLAGRSVGRVLSVDFRAPEEGGARIVIRAVLERGVEEFISADAEVSIQPGALLEPVIVFIHPGSPDAGPRDLGRPLTARDRTLSPETLVELGAALRRSGDSLRTQASRVSSGLTGGRGTLGRMLGDPAALAAAGRNVREAMTAFSAWESGSIGRLSKDTVIGPRIARIAARLDTLESLPARERATETFRETTEAVEAFQDRLAALAARLDAGEGSAGRALRDGELARQVALLRARIDSATVELALYPDRWLRVRVF